jgi:hypothetical protein
VGVTPLTVGDLKLVQPGHDITEILLKMALNTITIIVKYLQAVQV